MSYSAFYSSPLGLILLVSEDGKALSRLSFCDDGAKEAWEPRNSSLPLFEAVKRWLDVYFSGFCPPFTPPLSLSGTPFQQSVWRQIAAIPYGETATYAEIAARLSSERNAAASPRAVGAATSCNPVALIVPCHRVIGKGGSLKGYRWGLERKKALLELEGIAPIALS